MMSVAVWPWVMPRVEAETAAEKVGAGLKVAVTLSAAAIVTVQVFPELEAQPDQLPNTELLAGVAVRVTVAPEA